MSAGKKDIVIEQGATFTWVNTWVGVNITGYTIRMQVRSDASSSVKVLDLSTTTGEIVLTTPASGVFTVTVSATATAALTPGNYVYDLEMVNGSTVTRLLEGKCTVSAEVTR